MGKVIHRLSPCDVLHVEEVCTHLTCDFAVAEEHGDVEYGAAGENSECGGVRLDATEVLEGPQFVSSQDAVSVRHQFQPMILHERLDRLKADVE